MPTHSALKELYGGENLNGHDFGPWKIDEHGSAYIKGLSIDLDLPWLYANHVPLGTIRTAAELLDIICFIMEQPWGTNDVVAGLLRLYNYHINVRKYLCPNGKAKRITNSVIAEFPAYIEMEWFL
jgi:hypothetical protein